MLHWCGVVPHRMVVGDSVFRSGPAADDHLRGCGCSDGPRVPFLVGDSNFVAQLWLDVLGRWIGDSASGFVVASASLLVLLSAQGRGFGGSSRQCHFYGYITSVSHQRRGGGTGHCQHAFRRRRYWHLLMVMFASGRRRSQLGQVAKFASGRRRQAIASRGVCRHFLPMEPACKSS